MHTWSQGTWTIFIRLKQLCCPAVQIIKTFCPKRHMAQQHCKALRRLQKEPRAGRIESAMIPKRALLSSSAAKRSQGRANASPPTSHWVQQLWKPEQKEHQARWNAGASAQSTGHLHRNILEATPGQQQVPDNNTAGSQMNHFGSMRDAAPNDTAQNHTTQSDRSFWGAQQAAAEDSPEESADNTHVTAAESSVPKHLNEQQDVDSWCFANVLRKATGDFDVPGMLQQGQYFPPEIHFVAESQRMARDDGQQTVSQPQLCNCPAGEWEGCTAASALVFHTSHWKWDLYKDQIPLERP